jgi:hypothetical protein
MDNETMLLKAELLQTNPKMPFIVKVLSVLQFEETHRELANVVGAFWCDRPGSFVANSRILGAFLQAKANTINANFRQHGFTNPKFVSFEEVRNFRISLQRLEPAQRKDWNQRQHLTTEFWIINNPGASSSFKDSIMACLPHTTSSLRCSRKPFE